MNRLDRGNGQEEPLVSQQSIKRLFSRDSRNERQKPEGRPRAVGFMMWYGSTIMRSLSEAEIGARRRAGLRDCEASTIGSRV